MRDARAGMHHRRLRDSLHMFTNTSSSVGTPDDTITSLRVDTTAHGVFRCPREGIRRRYLVAVVRAPRPSLWRRLLPSRDECGRYVECTSCRSTFDTSVLAASDSPYPVEDVLTTALRRLVVALLDATGSPTNKERRDAVIVLQRLATRPYGPTDLNNDLAALESRSADAELASLAPLLNDTGRHRLVEAGRALLGDEPRRRAARAARLDDLTRSFAAQPVLIS